MKFPILALASVFFILCYAQGGQKYKWVKRFLGPGVLALSVLVCQFSWWTLFPVGAFFLPLVLPGYGDKFHKGVLWRKILIRSLHGLLNGFAGGLLAVLSGHYALAGVQVLTAIAGSIYFGVANPWASHGNRGVFNMDLCIALSAVWVIPFMAR